MPIDTELQIHQREFNDLMFDVWTPYPLSRYGRTLWDTIYGYGGHNSKQYLKYRGFYHQELQPGPEYEGWYPHGQRPKPFKVTFDTPFFIDKLILNLLNNYTYTYSAPEWERHLGGLPLRKLGYSLGIEESNKWRINKGGLVVQVPYKLLRLILMRGSSEANSGSRYARMDWCVTLHWINRRGSKHEEARDDDDYYHLNYNAGEFISVGWIICPEGKGAPYEVSIMEEGQQLKESGLNSGIMFYLGDTLEDFDKLKILFQSIFPFMNWNENPMEVK